MNLFRRRMAMKFASAILSDEEMSRLETIKRDLEKHDTGFGYDPFGAEFESALLAFCLFKQFYSNYFRVESFGHENIPKEGRAVLASNHSGIVPMDGAMIPIDIIKKMEPPRMVRAVVEKLFTKFPYTKDLISRVGQVIGIKRNFDELLKMENMVLVFPEGARGMGKTFSRRYKLTRFNVGFVELAIENKAPIVPIAVVGAEEQAPIIYNWEWFGKNVFDANAFPITPTWPLLGPLGLFPLPTKYFIYYGEPFRFWEEDPHALEKAEVIRSMTDRVQASVQKMLDEGVAKRKSVFFG